VTREKPEKCPSAQQQTVVLKSEEEPPELMEDSKRPALVSSVQFETILSSDTHLQERPKRKKRRNGNRPTAREVAASAEIDRLLLEAHQEYYGHNHIVPPASFDSNGTLEAAKAKFGSEKLLQLLRTKMCDVCKTKLGM
jgi:hypothetical protein